MDTSYSQTGGNLLKRTASVCVSHAYEEQQKFSTKGYQDGQCCLTSISEVAKISLLTRIPAMCLKDSLKETMAYYSVYLFSVTCG